MISLTKDYNNKGLKETKDSLTKDVFCFQILRVTGVCMKQLTLDPIQLEGVEFLRTHKKAIINLAQGKGKSRLLLQYLASVKFARCFIVVPKSILVRWVNEVNEWFEGKRNIHVISFGMLKTFASLIEEADIVVIDEPKLLKNSTNQVHRLLLSLDDCSIDGQQKILLDATIIENNLAELDAVADWFGISADRYQLLDYVYPPPGVENITARKVITKKIKLPIPRAGIPLIRYFESELAHCLIPKTKSKVAVNYAIGKLLDVLNGVGKHSLGARKIDAIIDIIKTRHPGEAGVICVTQKEAMNEILKRLTAAGLKAVTFHGELSAKARQEIVNKFEVGAVDWVIATKAGERGLNLSRGTVVCHYNLAWAGSSFIQRDRVTRRDSDLSKTTYIYVMLFEDTVEELVYQKVKAKVKMNKNLGDGIISQQWATTWKDFLVEKWQRVYGKDLTKGVIL